MNRREFLRNSGGIAALSSGLGVSAFALPDAAGATLSPWQPGTLDIHHINTGRGNSTLAILPDGTSLLIDAGASSTQGPAMCEARPNASLRPGQWIASYIQRQLKPTNRKGIDFALVTHLHGDHIGDITPQSPTSSFGGYKLTGISDVAEFLPIGTLIDRGFPHYSYPGKISDATGLNYIDFAKSLAKRGTRVEGVQVGSSRQISQQSANSNPSATIRLIAGNGRIWTGDGENSINQFPAIDPATTTNLPRENCCSIALRIHYGKFSYFTGGDLTSDTNYGRDPWRDTETPAGKVAGPVSVSTCNHHGYFDGTGPDFVSAVRPRVWVLQSWHASHPAMSSLANMYSPLLYPGLRDVFALGLHSAAALACGRFSDRFKSSQGHVLIRVNPDGAQFSVLVLDDHDERDSVTAAFGPFPS